MIKTIRGFMKRLNEDHVGAYAAQSAYFILLSFARDLIPFPVIPCVTACRNRNAAQNTFLAGKQILPGELTHIDPGRAVFIAEVKETRYHLIAGFSADTEKRRIIRFLGPDIRLTLKRTVFEFQLLHLFHRSKNLILNRSFFLLLGLQIPAEVAAVQITAVGCAVRIFTLFVGIIVDLADLIAAVDNRNTRLDEKVCVQHLNSLDRLFGLLVVTLVKYTPLTRDDVYSVLINMLPT